VKFHRSGYAFLLLIPIAIAGFWRSYFHAPLAAPTWFQIHVALTSTWIALLIVQPLLIRRDLRRWHRALGRASYVVFPLLIVSVVKMAHLGLQSAPPEELTFASIIVVPRDLTILITAYAVAIVRRHEYAVHARAMTCTGIAFIEPGLARLGGMNVSAITVLLLLTALVVFDRRGRTVFGPLLLLYAGVYVVIFLRLELTPLDPLVRWLAAL
jgi:uncharacterized membrane protein